MFACVSFVISNKITIIVQCFYCIIYYVKKNFYDIELVEFYTEIIFFLKKLVIKAFFNIIYLCTDQQNLFKLSYKMKHKFP